MTNANNTYGLKVEKVIAKPVADVFRALGEGRLFMNCGADHESLKIDFKVGGKYFIQFLGYGMKNCGEFLEITANQKIVFTWCQDYDSNPKPDTTVTVLLKDLGGKTALTLTHEGFEDKENCDAHTGGWTGGLDDLSLEITEGKLRFMRKIPLPIQKVFEACQKFEGKVLELVPGKKVVIDQQGTKVTCLLDTDDDDQNASWIELLHEGLTTDAQQKSHRARWDALLKKL